MNNNVFHYSIMGILYCAAPAICEAVTIASNSPAEVPADNFNPSLNYTTMRGVYRLMAYGDNRSGPDSNINGTITATMTTTDGNSQTVTMPICPLGMTACYAADEYFVDISPVDSPYISSPTNPVIQTVSSVGKIINTGTNTAWGYIYLRYKTKNPNDSSQGSSMGLVNYSVSAQGRCAMDVNDTIVILPLAAGQRAAPVVVTSSP